MYTLPVCHESQADKGRAKNLLLQLLLFMCRLPCLPRPPRVPPHEAFSRGRKIGHVVIVHEVRIPELLKLLSWSARMSIATA
jgi:hypothetical protein